MAVAQDFHFRQSNINFNPLDNFIIVILNSFANFNFSIAQVIIIALTLVYYYNFD